MDRRDWLNEVMRRKLERFNVLYSPGYDQSWGSIGMCHATFVKRVIQSVHPGGVILDAACGTGRFFSMIIESQRQVVGVDWSDGMLKKAHAKFPGVRIERQDLRHLGFQHYFDAAICVDALENLPPEDWPTALDALHRVARADAMVYLTAELADGATGLESAHEAALARGWPVVKGELAEDHGYHYYPEREAVRRWLDETRLTLVDQSDSDGYWHLLCHAARSTS